MTGPESPQTRAERKLYALILGDRALRPIVTAYGVTEVGLVSTYSELCRAGAGQWVRGNYYVAAVALALAPTLHYILETQRAPLPAGVTEFERWRIIADNLILYFETDQVGPVTSR